MSVLDLVARSIGFERVQAVKAAQVVESPYVWPAWTRSQPDWTTPTLQGFAQAGYGDNALVYACIARKAQSASLAPLRVYSGARAKPQLAPDTHWLATLLLRPNPHQSWYEFKEQLITYMDLDGNAFVYKARSPRGEIGGLYPLRSDRVRPVLGVGRTDPLLGYVYDPEDSGFFAREPFLPDEIIHVKYPNPRDPFEGYGRGSSPLGAAAKATDVDNAATSFLKTFFDQAVVPFGLLKSKQRMLDSEVARVRARLREQYGGVQNWGDVMVLDADADYQRLGLSMQEMTFDELDMRNEARICMVLGVPPIIVGARVGLERSTFANYGEARSAFWEDFLIPGIYRRFEDAWNMGLGGDGVWLAYDYSNVPALREDETEKWDTAVRAFLGGLIKRNEARALVKLPPVADEQDGFRAAQEQMIGQPGITQTPNTVGDGTAELVGETQDAEDEKSLPFGIRDKRRDDGHDESRRLIEDQGGATIGAVLQRQMRAAVPTGATAESLAGAGERLAAHSQELRDAVYAMMRDACMLGIAVALDMGKTRHGAKEGIGVDWSLVNADVLRWLDSYTFELVRAIEDNSRTALREAIERWTRNGLPLKDLITELEPIFGPVRAKMIAETEVTRAFAEANLRAWKASGVVSQVTWRTANDERVCPICAPLGGLAFGEDGATPARIEDQEQRAAVTGIDEPFRHPGGDGAAGRWAGKEFRSPPAHPRCRCWLAPIG